MCSSDLWLIPSDEVVISVMEHHSNIVPWQLVCERTRAVLAIPLTSIITIILAAFAPTRPLAVLLAENVDEFVTDMASRGETAAPDEPFLP